MTDTEIIFLVLAAIYLWECVCWTPAGAICFAASFDRPRPTGSLAPVAGNSGRITLASPLPLARTFVCQEWPLPLDACGLIVPARNDRYESVDAGADGDAATRDAGAGSVAAPDIAAERWLAFAAIKRIDASERHVVIDGRQVATLASHKAARLCVQRLQSLLVVPCNEREAAVRALLDELCDLAKISAGQAKYDRATAPLRFICACMWLAGFVAAPVVYWLTRSLVVGAGAIVLSVFLVLWSAVVVQYFFARRKLIEESRWATFGHTLLLAVSPASAMRAAETIGRDQFTAFEPAAVAAVACSPNDLASLAAKRLRDLRYPLPDECLPEDSDPGRAQTWFRNQLTTNIERALTSAGADLASLACDPPRSPDAATFCPRCQAQYIFSAGACPDCSLPVRPFAAPPTS